MQISEVFLMSSKSIQRIGKHKYLSCMGEAVMGMRVNEPQQFEGSISFYIIIYPPLPESDTVNVIVVDMETNSLKHFIKVVEA
jgi:hypothetical protein